MDFFERPELLTAGAAYKGPPATFTELGAAVAEEQEKTRNQDTLWSQLTDAYDKQGDEFEKAGLPRIPNPLRRYPTNEEWARIYREVTNPLGEGEMAAKDLGKNPYLGHVKNTDYAAAHFVRAYDVELKALAEKYPDKLDLIRPDRSPLVDVGEIMHKAERRLLDAQDSRNQAYSWFNPYRVAEGTLATLGGSLWGQRTSPTDLLANLAGGPGSPLKSLARNAFNAYMANAGVQALLEPGVQAQRAAVGLDAGIGDAVQSVAMAGAVGGAADLGIRAPVRAFNAVRAPAGTYGGIFRDAPTPEPTRAPVAPVEPASPTAPMPEAADLLRRMDEAEPGSPEMLAIMKEAQAKLPEAFENSPELRGAVAAAEIEQASPVKIDGVDEGDGIRAFAQMLRSDVDPQEPRPRLPDALPEARTVLDADRTMRVLADADADRLITSAKAAVDQAMPGLSTKLDGLIEAGHPQILDAIDAAVKRAKAGDEAAKIEAEFAENVLSLAREIGPERLAALADIHSGLGNPLDIARAVRAMPDLIDSSTPMTEGVQLARSLARLSDTAFGMVEKGEADPFLAQVVSDHVIDPLQHAGILDDLKRAGVTDPETARRTIPDLLPLERDPDAMPLDLGSKMDDPAGPEAKAQVERLKAEYATEMNQARATLEARKQQMEAVRQAEAEQAALIDRAEQVRAAIDAEVGIKPDDVRVEVFTSIDDLPAGPRSQVLAANKKNFVKALNDYMRAASDGARARAAAAMEDASSQRGVEGLYHDGTVWIAAWADSPEGKYVHEVVHALVDRGQLRADEVDMLANLARRLGVFTPEREALYRAAYQDRDGIPRLLNEEAAAHLLEAKRKGLEIDVQVEPEAPMVDGIFGRLQALWGKVKEAVAGKQEATAKAGADPAASLVDQILSGEIAKRERMARVLDQEDIKAIAVRDEGMFALRDRIDRSEPELDAPNFGLPEPPRAIPDNDPLLRPRDGDNSPERIAMRERLIEQRFAGKSPVPEGDAPIAYLMGGGGASGKGTILKGLRQAGIVDESFVELDPDSFKTGDKGQGWEGIPEYWELDARGDSRGASVTHEESSLVYKTAQKRGMEGRYNLVLDQTLGNPAKGEALIKALKDAGYEVHLVGVTVDAATAVERAVERAKGPDRRYVPLDHLLTAHKGFSAGFERYAELADTARLYDTADNSSQVIAEKRFDTPLRVVLEQSYSSFVRKAGINEKAGTIRELQSSLQEPTGSPRQADPRGLEEGRRGSQGGLDPQRAEDSSGLPRQRLDHSLQVDLENGGPAPQRGQTMFAFAGEQIDKMPRSGYVLEGGPGNKPQMGPLMVKFARLLAQMYIGSTYASEAARGVRRYGKVGLELANDDRLERKAGIPSTVREFAGQPFSYKIKGPDGSVVGDAYGYVVGNEMWFDWLGSYGWEANPRNGEMRRSSNQLGMRVLRDLREQVRKDFPEVSKFTGMRVSGAREKSGSDNRLQSVMFAFAGERAKTADLAALSRAKQMEGEGKPKEDIWSQTGWFKGVDGKWRFEIDDSGANLKDFGHGDWARLGDVMHNPNTFAAYPDIADYSILAYRGGDGGVIRPAKRQIEVGLLGNTTSTGLHEVQHGVQDVERFAQGANLDIARDTPEYARAMERHRNAPPDNGWTSVNTIADSVYRQFAGEVEARTVQKRMDYTPEQRKSRPPWLDYDVPENEQIVRFADGSGPMFAMADRDTGRDMRRAMDSLGYFSKLDEVLGSLGPKDKVTAQTLQQKGVKLAEIEARGLSGLLADGKSVPVSDLLETAGRNRVELREVRHGGKDASNDTIDHIDGMIVMLRDIANDRREPVASELRRIADVIARQRERNPMQFDNEFFWDRLTENEDAFNVLVAAQDMVMAQQSIPRPSDAVNTTKWSSYSLDPSNPSYRETVIHLPASQPVPGRDRSALYKGTAPNGDFRSGHFSEPNIIGHMMTSMTKHEGQPVYTVDQIQSDWGQKLRDGGARDDKKIADLSTRQKAARDEADRLLSDYMVGLAPDDRAKNYRPDAEDRLRAMSNRGDEFGRKWASLNNDAALLTAELRTATGAASGHPLVNTTDQWVNTTLRRAIRQAAEADAAYIAIPSGDTVLSYNPGDTEGMRGFYDKIVPKNLRNILQKIDKASPDPKRIDKLETPTSGLKGEGFTLFPLTDAVKRSVVSEGQPMFAIRAWHTGPNEFDSFDAAHTGSYAGSKYPGAFYFTERADISGPQGGITRSIRQERGKAHSYEVEIDDANALMLDVSKSFDEQSEAAKQAILAHPDIVKASWRVSMDRLTFGGRPFDDKSPADFAAARLMFNDGNREKAIATLESQASAVNSSPFRRAISVIVGRTPEQFYREAADVLRKNAEPQRDLIPQGPLGEAVNSGMDPFPPGLDKMGFDIAHTGDGDEIVVINMNRVKILSRDGKPVEGNPVKEASADIAAARKDGGGSPPMFAIRDWFSRDPDAAVKRELRDITAKAKAGGFNIDEILYSGGFGNRGTALDYDTESQVVPAVWFTQSRGEAGTYIEVGHAQPDAPKGGVPLMYAGYVRGDLFVADKQMDHYAPKNRNKDGTFLYDPRAFDAMLKHAKEFGYDGVRFKNIVDTSPIPHDQIAIFDKANTLTKSVKVLPDEAERVQGGQSAPMFAMAGSQATPGLDMSPEARKQRAQAMGFDTSAIYYHTSANTFDAFDLQKGGAALGPSFARDAPAYNGANVGAYYLRIGKRLSFNTGYEVTPRELVKFLIDGKYEDFNGDVRPVAVTLSEADKELLASTIQTMGWSADRADTVRRVMARNGVDGFEFVHEMITETIPFDPKNIRSTDAAFDPANSSSANLMFAMAGSQPNQSGSRSDGVDRLQGDSVGRALFADLPQERRSALADIIRACKA